MDLEESQTGDMSTVNPDAEVDVSTVNPDAEAGWIYIMHVIRVHSGFTPQ